MGDRKKNQARRNDRAELERFKTEIHLSQFAVGYGYQLDQRESSRNSAVMRNSEGDKIIIAREEDHWVYFSVRDDDDNGSVLDFVLHRDGGGLGRARQTLRRWMGSPPPLIPTHYAPDLETCTRDRAAIIRQFARLQPITDPPALAERGITRAGSIPMVLVVCQGTIADSSWTRVTASARTWQR